MYVASWGNPTFVLVSPDDAGSDILWRLFGSILPSQIEGNISWHSTRKALRDNFRQWSGPDPPSYILYKEIPQPTLVVGGKSYSYLVCLNISVKQKTGVIECTAAIKRSLCWQVVDSEKRGQDGQLFLLLQQLNSLLLLLLRAIFYEIMVAPTDILEHFGCDEFFRYTMRPASPPSWSSSSVSSMIYTWDKAEHCIDLC